MSDALPVTQRPFRHDPVDTEDLPATPTRDHRVPATAWRQAPDELVALGSPDEPAYFLRRIGHWLLWRAGPPVGEATYLAIDAHALDRRHRFELHGRTGEGIGPDGRTHERFRTWKEALRDA